MTEQTAVLKRGSAECFEALENYKLNTQGDHNLLTKVAIIALQTTHDLVPELPEMQEINALYGSFNGFNQLARRITALKKELNIYDEGYEAPSQNAPKGISDLSKPKLFDTNKKPTEEKVEETLQAIRRANAIYLHKYAVLIFTKSIQSALPSLTLKACSGILFIANDIFTEESKTMTPEELHQAMSKVI